MKLNLVDSSTLLLPDLTRLQSSSRNAHDGSSLGDGKGEERSFQLPRFPPSHHTQTGEELTTRLSYYEMRCHNNFCICGRNPIA